MPKFNVSVTFDLETTVEADGIHLERPSGVTNWSEDSYFSSEDITVSGGEFSFTVEAEDEDTAYETARETVTDGGEITDGNDLTWTFSGVDISVEEIDEPMTLERAVALLKSLLDKLVSGGQISDEEREAFVYVLDFVAKSAETPFSA